MVRLARAVDTAQLSPERRDDALRARWGAGPDTPIAIHVGRIAPEKNLALAVRAFRAIGRQRPDARFVWVGDGPARDALARENPDFIFCGVQRGEALARHFASGDLFLFPSLSETFGNVTIEAMACGVPVVSSDAGALPDVVRGAGIVVPAARAGSTTACQAYRTLGRQPKCGQCVQFARSIIDEERAAA